MNDIKIEMNIYVNYISVCLWFKNKLKPTNHNFVANINDDYSESPNIILLKKWVG